MTKRAAILAIGDELVLGEKVDTNSAWIASQLLARGLRPLEHRTVDDDRPALAAAIAQLASGHDVLIMTGGLGPTEDDLTREALGDVVDPGCALVLDADAERALAAWFRGRGRSMPARNVMQAMRPTSARILDNPHGTAPGLAAEYAGCGIFCLPGPPGEMRPMFEAQVLPDLDVAAPTQAGRMEAVHLYGLGESDAAERLGDLMDRARDPQVGITHSDGIITARVRPRGTAGLPAMAETVEAIERAWYPFAYGRGDRTLSASLGDSLRAARRTLVVAESCTGGWLGKMIVDEPGASDYFPGGWITYANSCKEQWLGVEPGMLAEHGAVSAPVAEAMAAGARERAGADLALAITGVAGPVGEEGGTQAKRPGLVFIGLAFDGGVAVRRFRYRGDRSAVRHRSALSALQIARLHLLGESRDLLWQVAI